MKLIKLLFAIILVQSCSKEDIDTSPKKVKKCYEWTFEYTGDKLNQINYLHIDYKIKFIYKDSTISQIEYYRFGNLETRTNLIYKDDNLIAEIDTTFQELNRYSQERREYNYLTKNELELKIKYNDWYDTVLKTTWNKKYIYKDENLVEIVVGSRTDKIEYDNHINPFYNIIGFKKLRYFSLRGETIILNTKNNATKYNTLDQKIEYSKSNQPLKYFWGDILYEQYVY